MSGWVLQSVVSGVAVPIPRGAETYRMGAVPGEEPIALRPGERAVVNSGQSPLGVSFRLNACSGYLRQFQAFSPSLPLSCPSSSAELPPTIDNLRTYGASCVDFVRTIPSCTYYLGAFPDDVTPTCRAFVNEALTYNSCVDRHQFDANFKSRSWRIYLGSQNELWNDAHDIIRLLDASGRTVDVWSY